MMILQIVVQLKENNSRIEINQLAREDATDDERAYIQGLQDVFKVLMDEAHKAADWPVDQWEMIE